MDFSQDHLSQAATNTEAWKILSKCDRPLNLISPNYLTTKELPISLVILPTLKNPSQVYTCFSSFKSFSKTPVTEVPFWCSLWPSESCS